MSNTYRIFPKKKQQDPQRKQNSDWRIDLKFQLGNTFYILTADGELLKKNQTEYKKDNNPQGSMQLSDPYGMRTIIFNDAHREEIVKFEDDTDENKKLHADFKEFWDKYPARLIEREGQKNQHALVCFYDTSKMKNEKSITTKLRNQITNTVLGMDERELRDVMYMFGSIPTGMSKEEMEVTLVDNSTGLLFNTEGVGDNMDTFKRAFIEKTTSGVDMKVTISHAKTLGIISNVAVGNGKGWYYGKDNLLGVDESDIISFFTKNERLYNSLKETVEREDKTESKGGLIKESDKPKRATDRAAKIAEVMKAINAGEIEMPEGKTKANFRFIKDEELDVVYNKLKKVEEVVE